MQRYGSNLSWIFEKPALIHQWQRVPELEDRCRFEAKAGIDVSIFGSSSISEHLQPQQGVQQDHQVVMARLTNPVCATLQINRERSLISSSCGFALSSLTCSTTAPACPPMNMGCILFLRYWDALRLVLSPLLLLARRSHCVTQGDTAAHSQQPDRTDIMITQKTIFLIWTR